MMRVVLAEDSVLLREGLVRLLEEAGTEVVAAVADGPSLVRAVGELRPDVAVVDVRMPPTHTDEGLRAAVEARAAVPGTGPPVTARAPWRPRAASRPTRSARRAARGRPGGGRARGLRA